ncbi:MAG TPA: acyl-CoA dehydrogenase family protein [Polyangiaceae bacterium]|nr:acyl-CoA dehydrogenase family protein [Polyangiaceae bacterium]
MKPALVSLDPAPQVATAAPTTTWRPAKPASTTAIDPIALRHELGDFDRFPVSTLLKEARPDVYQQCVDVMRRAREYTSRHVLPHAVAWDQEAAANHSFIPWAAIDAGLPYGFLGMNVPGVLGGSNFGVTAACVFAEEVAAADAGVYVIYGAHALALSLVIASLDLRAMSMVGREICEGEKRGTATLLALAHTEPTGGSDVEDVEDIRHADLGSRFHAVSGGVRVRARKVFISNGSIARDQVLTAFEGPRRPLETMAALLIPNDAPGLSIGRIERKLGQRLSSAAEVICDDVFVPDSHVIRIDDGARAIDTTLSLTRGPVGAMATGIIRGTLDRTLAYLEQKRVGGRWLFESQWVQLALADMVAALQASRGLYMDAGTAGDAWGIAKLMNLFPSHLPVSVRNNPVYAGLLGRPMVADRIRALYRSQVQGDQLQRLVAHASIAKFGCSDAAVRVSMQAMEILGEDANDPRWGVEKAMRDAKLGQIFEGTNQINRLHVARGMIRRA